MLFSGEGEEKKVKRQYVFLYLYNTGSNIGNSIGSSISIVGLCALYAFLEPNALYALENQKRTFNSRDHNKVESYRYTQYTYQCIS